MDPSSWTTLNHLSQLSASKSSNNDNHNNHHRAMANFPALSPPFSRQDASSLASFQGAAHLLLHPTGPRGASGDTFINPAATSELLKAGYSAAGLLPYAATVSSTQANLTHSMFNSFQQKESELNELREGFSRGLHPLSVLATSQAQNVSPASNIFASGLPQTAVSSPSWHLPSPVPSSSMFGVLPHESVGSKTNEKTRPAKSSSKSQSSSNNQSSSAVTTSKASSFVFGTSPSAGTTAKTVISNDLLSSPTYLPQPQYNSFLNMNEKKEVYDQGNAALDYTSSNVESTISSQKQDREQYSSDCQKTAKCDSVLSHPSPMSHQSPMMASQSPATNHNSPMVSSAVISPVEPPAYSPASNLRYNEQMNLDHIKSHSSPHGSSLCNHNSPMSSSNAGSPFVGESPRESLPSKDYQYVNSDLPSHYSDQQPMLSPTNCNLSSKENYDLMNQHDTNSGMNSVFSNHENFDDIALQDLNSIPRPSGMDETSNAGFKSDSSLTNCDDKSFRQTNGGMTPKSNDGVPHERQPIFRTRASSEHNADKSETKGKFMNRMGKQGGKPAGFFNSYLSFVKNSPPKGQRKRGRPRKYPVLPSNMGSRTPRPVRETKSPRSNLSGNYTFSDSEEEQDTNSHAISDTVQLALKTLTDDEGEKEKPSAKTSETKVSPKRKIYENSLSNSSEKESTSMDVYDFDSEFCEPEVKPTSFRSSAAKRRTIRKVDLEPLPDVSPPVSSAPSVVAPTPTNNIRTEPAIPKFSMKKCVEKLAKKRERSSKKKKAKHVKPIPSSDDGSDDDWIPMSKSAAAPNEESDNSETEAKPASKLENHPPPKIKKAKLESAQSKKKPRMLRRESADTNNDEDRSCSLKTGDFIINIKDMHKEKPCIWRIHGKGLIQKYESFDKDDKVLYQNISSFSSWNDDTTQDYLPVNVRFNYTQRGSCVVEYLGPVRTDPKFINQMMLETAQFQAQKENFEVYLQTLISQALDPNFISEIVKDNDEYFLSHMREIDEMAIRRKEKLIEDRKWSESFVQCVQYYPCVNIITSKSLEPGPCQACGKNSTCVKLVQFYGQPYDYTTLRRTALSPNSLLSSNKEFITCDSCSDLVNLYNRLHHQKYNFYIACHTKVNQVRVVSKDMRLESHVILEKCLQDNDWINKMFEEIISLWLECDRTR